MRPIRRDPVRANGGGVERKSGAKFSSIAVLVWWWRVPWQDETAASIALQRENFFGGESGRQCGGGSSRGVVRATRLRERGKPLGLGRVVSVVVSEVVPLLKRVLGGTHLPWTRNWGFDVTETSIARRRCRGIALGKAGSQRGSGTMGNSASRLLLRSVLRSARLMSRAHLVLN